MKVESLNPFVVLAGKHTHTHTPCDKPITKVITNHTFSSQNIFLLLKKNETGKPVGANPENDFCLPYGPVKTWLKSVFVPENVAFFLKKL